MIIIFTMTQKTSTWNSESIYVTPGSDVDTLYGQLNEIQTSRISRRAIRLVYRKAVIALLARSHCDSIAIVRTYVDSFYIIISTQGLTGGGGPGGPGPPPPPF